MTTNSEETAAAMRIDDKIPLGVSQCLLGEPVRYDGGHKRDDFLCGPLADYVHFQPLCPELAIGLGVPRPPIHLVVHAPLAVDTQRVVVEVGDTRVRGVASKVDVTEALYRCADEAMSNAPPLCGYVWMQNSPSCGLASVKRHSAAGALLDTLGQGAFAQRVQQLMPYLPMEEAQGLADNVRRDNFLARVFALYDYRRNVEQNPSPRAFIAFYSRYKYQVMAHHVPSYKMLGRHVAQVTSANLTAAVAEFRLGFMQALARPASRAGHSNALEHLRGYVKRQLTTAQQQQLSEAIRQYRLGEWPLSAPLGLLKAHADQLGNAYLQAQSYWQPYPPALALPEPAC